MFLFSSCFFLRSANFLLFWKKNTLKKTLQKLLQRNHLKKHCQNKYRMRWLSFFTCTYCCWLIPTIKMRISSRFFRIWWLFFSVFFNPISPSTLLAFFFLFVFSSWFQTFLCKMKIHVPGGSFQITSIQIDQSDKIPPGRVTDLMVTIYKTLTVW